jgi:(1->4)-alpha-D-glucan 1-alpha-D-glucosylmutase
MNPDADIANMQIGATVRLQFHREFIFDDAIRYLDYFAKLGITHLYASPILTARQNSTHGYDIVDPTQINMELGGIEGLKRLVSALRQRNMGLIIDIVPNHMGVGGNENPWWQHVLEWGRRSPYSFWFDIDWFSTDPHLHNKVLAPFLGEPYGDVLDKGDITLGFNASDGRIQAQYFTHHFPIALADYAAIFNQANSVALEPVLSILSALNFQQAFLAIEEDVENITKTLQVLYAAEAGKSDIDEALANYNSASPESRDAMHQLLDRQHYRLTWWRNAADEINWRRFFEVCELAGVRVELEEVFEATHSLIFDLYEQGLIDGLRLDHIDGLANPQLYCQKLRARLEGLIEKRPLELRQQPYLIAEKILASQEWLPTEWGLQGTTGYEFMDQVSAVLHDPRGVEPLTQLWRQITNDRYEFSQHVISARRQLLSENLVGEFNATAAALHRIARADLHTRDYSLAAIKRVLIEILVHFPVYRTYISADGPTDTDKAVFELTANNARRTLSSVDKPLVDIILSWLSADLVKAMPESSAADLSKRAMTRFQQLTPPLLAKSVEDTAFYRYGRLLSRNEVGSDPAVLSIGVQDFHDLCIQRQKRFPQSLLATATHDHKRGEDARARIAVLSQIPQRWAETLMQWLQINARFHQDIQPNENPDAIYSAPRPHHEYMFYQTLLGHWPYELSLEDPYALKAYADRLNEWLMKSIREAKRFSNWVQANESYEAAVSQFLFDCLDFDKNPVFLQSVYAFVQDIAASGAINSLSMTLLRLTTPGIPDLYQGTELWDFSLVDPDNRRPVDYMIRQEMLNDDENLAQKLGQWKNGAVKQHVIQRVLNLRQQYFELFNTGDYVPLEVSGPRAAHVVAFMRKDLHRSIIVITPRLTHSFTELQLFTECNLQLNYAEDSWKGTLVHLPDMMNSDLYDGITGQGCHVYSGRIELAKVFKPLPLALLLVGSNNQ